MTVTWPSKVLVTKKIFGREFPTGLGPQNFNSARSWIILELPLFRKCLTKTPVRTAPFVLQCPDDRKNGVVGTQATYTSGSSAVGG
jgi:hypothetical protein